MRNIQAFVFSVQWYADTPAPFPTPRDVVLGPSSLVVLQDKTAVLGPLLGLEASVVVNINNETTQSTLQTPGCQVSCF